MQKEEMTELNLSEIKIYSYILKIVRKRKKVKKYSSMNTTRLNEKNASEKLLRSMDLSSIKDGPLPSLDAL